MKDTTFWLTVLLTVVVAIVPVVALRLYISNIHPTLTDRVRLKQRFSQTRFKQSDNVSRTPSTRRSRRSLRSGYAFAHQEGFGRLITSGNILTNTKMPGQVCNFNTYMLSKMRQGGVVTLNPNVSNQTNL